MKRILFAFAAFFAFIVLCSAEERIGEINRGIFSQEGIASWYGNEFNGRPTASGEIFNDSLLTAAHPILPFGTLLKITNQHNNKTTVVRVNDRGPFVAERIIDLSREAALQLDMVSTGTAPVRVESLSEVSLQQKPFQNAPVQPAAAGSASAAPTSVSNGGLPAKPGEAVQVRPASVELFSTAASNPGAEQSQYQKQGQLQPVQPWAASIRLLPAIPETATGKNYRVQVGAYKQPEYAAEAFEKVKKAGLNPSYERYGDYYRVVIAGLKQEELKTVSERLGTAGFREALLREE